MANRNLNIAIAILAVMIGFNAMQLFGGGIVQADYFYLPLHEFVASERHREMEDVVIKLCMNSKQRSAVSAIVLLAVAVGLVVTAKRSIQAR